MPMVMTVFVSVKPLLWQVSKTYNLTGSGFPPLVIQKYNMYIDGVGTLVKRKNKLFLSGKVTHTIIIELF